VPLQPPHAWRDILPCNVLAEATDVTVSLSVRGSLTSTNVSPKSNSKHCVGLVTGSAPCRVLSYVAVISQGGWAARKVSLHCSNPKLIETVVNTVVAVSSPTLIQLSPFTTSSTSTISSRASFSSTVPSTISTPIPVMSSTSTFGGVSGETDLDNPPPPGTNLPQLRKN
jgi:hypothetical protein